MACESRSIFCIFVLLNIKVLYMRISWFCQRSKVLHSKGFFFEKCHVLVRLLYVYSYRGRDYYALEVTRYRNGVREPTNVRVDDWCFYYRDALNTYLFAVQLYQHYYDMDFEKRYTYVLKSEIFTY